MTHAPARPIVRRLFPLAACLCLAAAPLGAEDDPAATARRVLEESGVTGGLVVHVGCGGGRLTCAIGEQGRSIVQGLTTSATDARGARKLILERGLYGRVSARHWDGLRLPYADNLVNLVVVGKNAQCSPDEVQRVLAPGGVALVWSEDGSWSQARKPRPANIDEWTHYFHGADGNPVARDEVVGPPRRLQWVGGPRWSRHHDHMASMTSLVSSGGKVFYIIDEGSTASIHLPSRWCLVARDAFNGTNLWRRELESWNTHQWPLKSGPAHLTRRLVAVDGRVYVTLGLESAVSALDAATGRTLRTYEGSDRAREIVVSDGVLLAVVGMERSTLTDWRRRDAFVWSNTERANSQWAWTGGERRIRAYDTRSGGLRWQLDAPVAPCSLASDGSRAVFYDGERVVCLQRDSGKRIWQSEPIPARLPVHTSTGPRTLIHRDVVLFAGNDGRMTALSAASGEKLWEARHEPSGHQSLRDLLVAGGLVWTAPIAGGRDSGVFTGRDPRTGEVKRQFKPDVDIYWFHHRCYPSKATERFLLTSRTGIEFVDPSAEHWETHHWVRGGCIYGVLPANGMVYAPMHSCGCYLEAKLNGFNALAPGPLPRITEEDLSDEARWRRGPAHGSEIDGFGGEGDWPTYRCDPARSGRATTRVPTDLKRTWTARIGGRLTPPVVAGGHVFVASIDAHTLYALSARDGTTAWTFTPGGRIDSPPTIHAGVVVFGSADGSIYALRATDGELVWRFRAAPSDRQIVSYNQLESIWPVHGSVLVIDGVVYATAGRSIFLDGGLRFLKIDALTGRKLAEVVWDERDPQNGGNMQTHVRGLNMPVALSDVLSFDGRHLYMRSQKIDLDGTRLEIAVGPVDKQHEEDRHLFCQVGFLDDSWFHRSFWTYGRRVNGGYGGWLTAGRYVPAGRILAFDAEGVYGYGRKPEYFVNSSVLEYHLFAAEKKVSADAAARVRAANSRINTRSTHRNANSSDWKLRRAFPPEDLTAVRYRWRRDQPSVLVRALAATPEHLVIAGPPDTIDERRAFRLPDDPSVQEDLRKQAAALEGRSGGLLWMVSKADGQPVSRYRMDSPPVFDGLALANGRVFISRVDGAIECLGREGDRELPRAQQDDPVATLSVEPEEPDYLKPASVDLSSEFDRVTCARVSRSELGYRLEPTEKNRAALALRKLPSPVTGSISLAARLEAPGVQGFLANGFLVFGDGVADERLIKCGVRFRTKKAWIVEGTLRSGAGSSSIDLPVPVGEPVDLRVEVDVGRRVVTLTAGDRTLIAKIERRLDRVTHVGFATDNAVADFGQLEIGK